MKDWKEMHGDVIDRFLLYLNSKTDQFILKGGTALLECYGLDRFSEDIDFDGKESNIGEYVAGFCEENQYDFRIAKDTDTVKRYMIHYGNDGKPLKVETSFRRKHIPAEEITKINGVQVYRINPLCTMKVNAYMGRDKLRDLYDIAFICGNYFEELQPEVKALLQNALMYKGIEHFDYIVSQERDELIDENRLAESFLAMFDQFDLLYTQEEKEILQEASALSQNEAAQLEEKPNQKYRKKAAGLEL